MEERICLEGYSRVGVWCAYDGQNLAVVIEDRRIHRIEAYPAYFLLVDIVALVCIHYIPVGIRICSRTKNHLFENLRRSRIEHFSARTIHGDVRPRVVSYVIHHCRHVLGDHVLV